MTLRGKPGIDLEDDPSWNMQSDASDTGEGTLRLRKSPSKKSQNDSKENMFQHFKRTLSRKKKLPSSEGDLTAEREERSSWYSTLTRLRAKAIGIDNTHLKAPDSPTLSKSKSFGSKAGSPEDKSGPLKKSRSMPHFDNNDKSPQEGYLLSEEALLFKNIPARMGGPMDSPASSPRSFHSMSTSTLGSNGAGSVPVTPKRNMYSCTHEGCTQAFQRFHLLNKHVQEVHGSATPVMSKAHIEPEYKEERQRLQVEVEEGKG
eukprot:comp11217_c0_seq1/m.5675 comp11217_c0_seq1/g.5675  ORF comp11217_c0_seq1/g.5675 comp11217_c0_seq1/m.5675 type:complete len:260 (-) comp11217_c0_seq1:566-1345(-)